MNRSGSGGTQSHPSLSGIISLLLLSLLEPVSKSFEEDNEAGKLDKAEEIVGEALPATEEVYQRLIMRCSLSPITSAGRPPVIVQGRRIVRTHVSRPSAAGRCVGCAPIASKLLVARRSQHYPSRDRRSRERRGLAPARRASRVHQGCQYPRHG